MSAQITNIDSVRPEIQSAYYFFDTEDDAQMFVLGVKEDLAEQEFFDYVGSDVEYTQVGNPVGNRYEWRGQVDYIDRTPKTPEAA